MWLNVAECGLVWLCGCVLCAGECADVCAADANIRSCSRLVQDACCVSLVNVCQIRELVVLIFVDVIPSTLMSAITALFFGVAISAAIGILVANKSPSSVLFVVPMFAACAAGTAAVMFVQVSGFSNRNVMAFCCCKDVWCFRVISVSGDERFDTARGWAGQFLDLAKYKGRCV